MPRTLRLLICCLLALALPVQALAAGLRLHCLVMPASMPTAVSAAGAAPAAGSPEALPPCHGHPGAAPQGLTDHAGAPPALSDSGSDQDANAPDPADAEGNPHRCSACAACVLGLALLDTPHPWPAAPAPGHWQSAPASAMATLSPAPAERPPRTHEA